ncbi:MAG TPA: hypothetical protein VHE56_06925 [Mycobacteriales bacterium]|nr:hypothetical protein [Mycobacteriales bacterium]
MRAVILLVATGLATTTAAGCSGTSSGGSAPSTLTPASAVASVATWGIDPTIYRDRVDNPWFPLPAGARWVYAGFEGGAHNRDVVTVLHRTTVIGGVRCVVVRDDVSRRGHVTEHTFDYYAQSRDGSVWYFGEDTGELTAAGKVKTNSGSWHAGTDGATPGIVMPAHPAVGQSYAQEGYTGRAEDHARVVSVTAVVRVPAASSRQAVETTEWSPLEPKVREHKYYVRGVGEVRSAAFRGPTETDALTSYRLA